MKNLLRKLREIARTNARKLFALRATPHQIALGFAVGVFIGIFPTFGLGFILILAVAAIWRFNVPAAVIGTLFGNPLFSPFWIVLSCLIVRIDANKVKVPPQMALHEVVKHFSGLGLRYLAGNAVLSLTVATVAYFLVKKVVEGYRRRKGGSRRAC